MENKVNSLKKTARLAGFMFLFYIAISFISMAISNQASSGAIGVEAKLASIAQHVPLVRLSALLSLLTFFVAAVLAVALFVLTHNQNPYIALLALCCRIAEGIVIAISAVWTFGLLSVATASPLAAASDSAVAHTLGGFLFQQESSSILISATCFAVGSTLYSYLFLRARSIPVLLAWFGLLASMLLVVALPLQILGFLSEVVNIFIWLPMLVFEVTLALWLLVKGVAIPVTQ